MPSVSYFKASTPITPEFTFSYSIKKQYCYALFDYRQVSKAILDDRKIMAIKEKQPSRQK